MITDQGRQFISSTFKEFIVKHDIKHVLTSPYNPTCNTIVERNISSIVKIARISRG